MNKQTERTIDMVDFVTRKLLTDNPRNYKTCSGCGIKTSDFRYVDCCGRVFCNSCAPDMVINEGVEPDNPIYTCIFCYDARRNRYE